MTSKPHISTVGRRGAHKQHEPGNAAKMGPKATRKEDLKAKGHKAKEMATHTSNPEAKKRKWWQLFG